MEEKEFYRQLIHRYVTNQATEEELEAFFHLMGSGEMDKELQAYMEQEAALMAAEETAAPAKVRRLWPRIAAAASVLLALSVGGYFLLHRTHEAPLSALNVKNDIAPGHDQATLTLADGRKIVLTKGLNGKLAEQGNMVVRADSAKGITYTASDQVDHTLTNVSYNTLSTKRGEASPYPLVLPDGSKVWLNAASSVTFPTAFAGKTREVSVTGEAYFEVVHDAKQPFRVKAANQVIEDIGTSFDVNAYADEPVWRTTLIEGSVKINNSRVLKPGQQGQVMGSGVKVIEVDAHNIIAWKEHMFRFNDESLEEIMRQAARWYDFDVKYEHDQLKAKRFGSIVKRFATASEFLHKLELTGEVTFRIEGRQITVMNK